MLDILHVRQGENYLVTDFTRSERLRDDPAVMDILAQVSREIGFDRVRVWDFWTAALSEKVAPNPATASAI